MKMGRRDALGAMGAMVAAPLIASSALAASSSPKPLRGVMPVAQTPYDNKGEIVWDELAREMRIYEQCGAQGLVWASGGSDVYFLTKEERLHGMTVVADACRPLDLACVLAVHAQSTDEMLELAEHAVNCRPDALYIASPMRQEKTPAELLDHFLALAQMTNLPLVVFGSVNSSPTIETVVELANRIPNPVYFRTDGQPVRAHFVEAIAAKPAIKGVFGASAASRWLFEQRLGSDGMMTHYGMYADVMEHLWQAWEAGEHRLATEIYSKLLLMTNLDSRLLSYKEEQIPGTMRYILKKRGWFSSAVARHRVFPTIDYEVKEIELSPIEREEIDARFAMLEPWLADIG